MITISEAPEAAQVVRDLTQEFHPDLIELGIAVRFSSAKRASLNAVVVQVISRKLRDAFPEIEQAFLLTICEETWDRWDEPTRRAHLGNALCACGVSEKGEPKMRSVAPLFPEAIERYGPEWCYEAKVMRNAVQYQLDLAGEQAKADKAALKAAKAATPKTPKPRVHRPAHSEPGVLGTIAATG